MTTVHFKAIVTLALFAGVAGRASAADQTNPWSLSILGGDSVAVSGSLRSPSTTSFADLGAIAPPLAGAPGTLSLDKLRYEDMFKRRYDAGLELDYSLTDNMSLELGSGRRSLRRPVIPKPKRVSTSRHRE